MRLEERGGLGEFKTKFWRRATWIGSWRRCLEACSAAAWRILAELTREKGV